MPELSTNQSCEIAIIKGRELKDVEKIGKMDPYVVVTMGSHKLRSETFSNAGKNVSFNSAWTVPYNGEENVEISVMDSNTGKDKLSCSAVAKVSDLQAGVVKLPMKDAKGNSSGTVDVVLNIADFPTTATSKHTFIHTEDLPTQNKAKISKAVAWSSLNLVALFATGLYDPDLIDKLDPYVIINVGNRELRSETKVDAGTQPNFNTSFFFPYDCEKNIQVRVMDREKTGKDRVLGEISMDLETIDLLSTSVHTLNLKHPKGKAGGHIKIRLNFSNSPITSFIREATSDEIHGTVKNSPGAPPKPVTTSAGGDAQKAVLNRSATITAGIVESTPDETTDGEGKITEPVDVRTCRFTVYQVAGLPLAGSPKAVVKIRLGSQWLETTPSTNQDPKKLLFEEKVISFPYTQQSRAKFEVWDTRTNKKVASSKVSVGIFALSQSNVFEGTTTLRTDLGDEAGKLFFRSELRKAAEKSGVFDKEPL